MSAFAMWRRLDVPGHDAAWRTRSGRVEGYLAHRRVDHLIERRADGWHLDGNLAGGLAHLEDLDYGFTPATNLQQLGRVAPALGVPVDIPVVWFDLDGAPLSELPQRYERRSETTYWHESPSVPYEGLLELAPNGFARTYPALWRMES